MNPLHRMLLIAVAATPGLAPTAGIAEAPDIARLERQVRENPASGPAKAALAEAYLRQCDLEKSLALWQEILAERPDHARARFVVERLTTQALDLNSHLDVLEQLIDRGITQDLAGLLDAASRRAASDSQKARILVVRGRLALNAPAVPEAPAVPKASRPTQSIPGVATARPHFEAACRLYPDTAGAARAAMALARLDAAAGRTADARRRLQAVMDNARLPDDAARQDARLELVLIGTQDATAGERIAAIRSLLARLTAAPVRRRALERLIAVITDSSGRWTPDAVAAAEAILASGSPFDEANGLIERLTQVARGQQDAAVLQRLVQLSETVRPADAGLAAAVGLLRVEALLSLAVVADEPAEVRLTLRRADDALAALDQPGPEPVGPAQAAELRGRLFLIEAQKRLALAGPTEALPSLMKAKDHYLAARRADPGAAFERLERIAGLLDEVGEPETAVALYREFAQRFAHRPQGRDALLKAAGLIDRRLGDATRALQVYAAYAARYPAELPYRQLELGERLRRLGYANLLDFQKRAGLTPDGIAGPKTRRKLRELEAGFDMISVADDGEDILRGVFVHPTIFKIARRLEARGHHHDAITAYRLLVNLFPTKREADDAVLAIARLFRANHLFEEALGAYAEMIEEFPKGNMTSEAYVEAAGCLENLGRWAEAREYYELYVKKFPKYKHVVLCTQRIALLDEIAQYEEFIATNPDSPKRAEARYQIATILYKQLKNPTKAAVEYRKIVAARPKHVRAAEGLYTAGVAQLHVENFPAARECFKELVRRYPDSRLADDGQFWIGHTYEYSARALGKLDAKRIVLKRRGLAARDRLLADLELRRRYFLNAQPGPAMPPEVWGADTLGVLASGSKRDRVNAELFRAIRAYEQVVETFKMGDMAGNALLRIGTIYTKYLKDPDKGIAAYQRLLAHYPGSKEAVDALFEVGDYHARAKRYDEAIQSFRQFIYNYPRDAKVEDAMLAIARCHADAKVWDKALDAYQSYLNKFPDGKHAETAKARIAWIRMYHF